MEILLKKLHRKAHPLRGLTVAIEVWATPASMWPR